MTYCVWLEAGKWMSCCGWVDDHRRRTEISRRVEPDSCWTPADRQREWTGRCSCRSSHSDTRTTHNR